MPWLRPEEAGRNVLLEAFAAQSLPHLCLLLLQGMGEVPSCPVCQPHLSGAAGCTGEHADGESAVSPGSAPAMQLHGPSHSPEREQLATSGQGRRQGAPLLRGIQNLEQVKTATHRRAVWGAEAEPGEGCIYLYNICIVRTN